MTPKDVLKSHFKLLDVDGKGLVTLANLKRVLNFDLKLGVSDALIEDMLSACHSSNQAVDVEQFIKLMK